MSQFLSRIPEVRDQNTKCIIMLHGVGSNDRDIFHLASGFSSDIAIFSLRGPFSLGGDRYAWYPVDFSAGKPVYSSRDLEFGYQSIVQSVSHIQSEYGFDPDHVFLFGFSQGAMIAYYTFWKSPELFGGIVGLAGRLLAEIDLDNLDEDQYEGKKLFIGHGVEDTMVPVTSTGPLVSFVRKIGIEPSLYFYNTGHSIIQEEIRDIIDWIKT